MLLLHLLNGVYYAFVMIFYPLIVVFMLWQILLLLKSIYKIGKQIVVDLTSYSSLQSQRQSEWVPLDMTHNIMSRHRVRLHMHRRRNRSKTL